MQENSSLDLGQLVQGTLVSGSAYVSSVGVRSYTGGKIGKYVLGLLKDVKGVEVSFKIWDTTSAEIIESNPITGKVCKVVGKVGSYQGVTELTLEKLEEIENADVTPFLPSLDRGKIQTEMYTFFAENTSLQAVEVVNKLFIENPVINSRFFNEYAGSSMHGAILGGLAQHTLNMLKYAKVLVETNAEFIDMLGGGNAVKGKDLLYLSVFLHDIGKTQEMKNGVYQEQSYITHRIIGVQMLERGTVREYIEETYGADFYAKLLSVLVGHHDAYGDPATTIIAKTVHLLDMLESQTEVMVNLVRNKKTELVMGVPRIRLGTTPLVV